MKNMEKILKAVQNLKLLYVEDNKEARESTFGLLSNIFDDVTVAVDGKDGLDKFVQNSSTYDLVITDINMPLMNGIDMIKQLRKIDTQVTIFILSAYDDNEYQINEDMNVKAKLNKPIDINIFMQELTSSFVK
jgi:YesN/AraC family two-component response regulator